MYEKYQKILFLVCKFSHCLYHALYICIELMEFLFSNPVASFEAIIVLLSVALIAIILLYDVYLFLARVLGILTPRKEYIKEKIAGEEKKEEVPIIEAIRLSEFEESIVPPQESAIESENITGDASHEIGEGLSFQEESLREVERIEPELNHTPREEEWVWWEEATTPATELRESLTGEELAEKQSESAQAGEEFVGWTEERGVIQEKIILEEPTEHQEDKQEERKSESLESPTIESLILQSEADTQIPKDLWREESPQKKSLPQISPENREKLVNITGSVRTLIARGHIVEARALIIEWLSLSKVHRELNIILGELYERDHAFDKAEFIYKDIAHIYEDDVEILMHLAASLAMQRKYRVSYAFYQKILTLSGDTEELLYTLAHLASELWETDEVYEYARNYNNLYPKNPEILWLLSQSFIARGSRREAIEILIKLKNLTPYNQEIVDLIAKLVVEEEMAGNFWGEK